MSLLHEDNAFTVGQTIENRRFWRRRFSKIQAAPGARDAKCDLIAKGRKLDTRREKEPLDPSLTPVADWGESALAV